MVQPLLGKIAFWGSLLVVVGGFSRALWKLIMARSGGQPGIISLESALFLLMAPGYILLAWSVWQTARSVQGKKTFGTLLPPLAIVAVMFFVSYQLFRSNPGSPAWERLLVSMMVIAVVLTSILLIAFASHLKLPLAAGLFFVNLVVVLVMNGMARLPELSIRLHWIAEAINTVGWLAFALGAGIVYRSVRANLGAGGLRQPDRVLSVE